MTEVDDFLAHYGVKGMKWGKRKAPASTDSKKPVRKKMSPETKELIGGLLTTAALVTVNIAVRKGAMWAIKNPDKMAVFMQRAQNTMNGTKAIGVGYDVIKIASG